VARSLLGKTLASDLGGARVSGIIIETEAYLGVHDAASHAWRGRRHRHYNGIYAAAGTWYIYRSYGMHWCLNLTAPTNDDGAAVLIRAVVPVEGLDVIRARRGSAPDRQLTNGPGKLGQAFAITGEHNGMVATKASLLRLEPVRRRATDVSIDVTPRIGITRAVEWPLRFVLKRKRLAARRERGLHPAGAPLLPLGAYL
jgi:DNA-3-methyladenine glycosylase